MTSKTLKAAFLAAALGSVPAAADAQPTSAAPLGQADIAIPVESLDIGQSQVRFTIDKRRVNVIRFLGARTGQLYSGSLSSDRLCPVFRAADHNFTRRDEGHIREVRANVSAADAAAIRRAGCVTIPDMHRLR